MYRVRRVFLEVTLSLQVAANLQLYTSHALCGLESDFLAAEKQTVSAERPHRPPRVMGCLRLIRWRRWDFTAEGESRPSTSGAVLKLTPTDSVVYQNAFFKGITTGYFQSPVLPKVRGVKREVGMGRYANSHFILRYLFFYSLFYLDV